MKKKLLSIFLALLLVCSLVTPAYAVPTPNETEGYTEVVSAVDSVCAITHDGTNYSVVYEDSEIITDTDVGYLLYIEDAKGNIMYIDQATASNGKVEFTGFLPMSVPECKVSLCGDFDGTAEKKEIGKLLARGTTVTGKVRGYNSEIEPVVQLFLTSNTTTTPDYTATITNKESDSEQCIYTFLFEGVAADSYKLVVTKKTHLKVTIANVVVDAEPLALEGHLYDHTNRAISFIQLLCGDLNENGAININDLNEVWNVANYDKNVGEANNRFADLNGNGVININDLNIVWNAANYDKVEGDNPITFS